MGGRIARLWKKPPQSDIPAQDNNPVSGFIRFWREMEQTPAIPWIIVLCFKHTAEDNASRAAAWFNQLTNGKGELGYTAFQQRFETPGAVLPELTPVTHTEVISWADSYSGDVAKLFSNVEKLKAEIENFYRHEKSGNAVPMRDLLNWLRKQSDKMNPVFERSG